MNGLNRLPWGRRRLMPVGVLIQACMSTGSVPGLFNESVGGKTYLQHQLDRVLVAFDRQDTVVVTTEMPENRVVVRLCDDLGIACYVGDRYDALGNCVKAARKHGFRSVTILRADCPLIDPVVMVQVMAEFLKLGKAGNYVGNRLRPTYPAGMEVEITGADTLQEAFLEARQWADFLDPTVLIRRGELARCRRVDVVQPVDQSRWRFRLDTEADHQRLSRLIGRVRRYCLEEVMAVAEAHGLLVADEVR